MIRNVKLKVDLLGNPGNGFYVEWDGNATGGFPTLEVLEEFLAKGEETFDLFYEGRMAGVEAPFILVEMDRLGYPIPADALAIAKKYAEVTELTNEEWRKMTDASEKYGKDLLTIRWTPDDITSTPAAANARNIIRRKHRFEELMAIRAEEIKTIAKMKGVNTAGTKEAIARRVHQHDFGDPNENPVKSIAVNQVAGVNKK